MATLTQFINENFLESTLKKYLKKKVKIVNFNTSRKENVGDHYCSILIHIVVNYCTEESDEIKEIAIVAKTFPEDKNAANFVISMNCFENEQGMYGELLPAINNLDYRRKISPDLIGSLTEPTPTLLMENLVILGYKVYHTIEGLDLQHCLLIMDKLAYLHAASIAVYEKDPTSIEKYNVGMFVSNDITTYNASVTLSTLKKVCSKLPGLGIYESKICPEKIIEKIYASRQRSENFNVLNHGDMWIKNFMFKYDDEKKVEDVLFLDYQFSYFCSPSLDLHYFWAVCTNTDVKRNHQKDVFDHYYNEFVKNLLKLRVTQTPPSKEEFKADFRARASFGLAATVIFFPVMIPKDETPTAWDTYLSDNSENCFRNICFTDDKFVKHLNLLLPFYDSLGVFD